MSDAESASAATMPLHRGLTDDLRLAHLLADDADSITMSRFKALDLHVDRQARPHPGHRRRHRRRGGDPAHRSAGRGRGTPCTARRWPTPAGARAAG